MRDRCRVCNRKLTVSKSQERGVGPKCYYKLREGYRGIQVEQFESIKKLSKKLKIGAE